jgi:hypothetical protein
LALERTTGADVLGRNGDVIVVNLRVGFVSGSLLRDGDVLDADRGLGLAGLAEVGIGLGGANTGIGPALVWNAGHPFGFNTFAIQAKVLRPWLISPWEHALQYGVQADLGVAIFKFSAGLYTTDPDHIQRQSHLQIGGGLRVWF